jgi:hypothetical protein
MRDLRTLAVDRLPAEEVGCRVLLPRGVGGVTWMVWGVETGVHSPCWYGGGGTCSGSLPRSLQL